MERHSQIIRGRPVTGKDVANAKDYFEHFLNATSLKNILGYYRSICDLLNLKPNLFPLFYPKLRNHLTSWRAKALWKKFDLRSQHKCYGKGKLCSNTRVLIIGAGPCGLRTAIEAQLLGAKVVVIEKRDRLSRNNVLHLWPFVIEDLRALGAKKFFGKFCAGAIDHISIRQIQCILLKVALLLGVEVHTEVSFEQLIEPNLSEKTGWKAEFQPSDHPVSQYVFDVIIGADGKRNTLQGFKRKEFRGKLAIAITANFINKRTEAEARVEEISGVAFIFNQKFFKELHEATGIDLENIVYYKDDTHYFVMTAKKTSLIEKGVIKQDLNDTERLLAPDNVNRDALMDYAREAANFSTNYQMPDLEFAVNHYGQPDVAMFDFTSMYAAENASKVVERNNYRLLMILVGDSLLEPFWPTGSGCARGFLSSMDAAWAIRSWDSSQIYPLDVIAERESIYRLLAQTTPDNLNKDCKAYTLDPATRYPNLNKNVVLPHQVVGLYDTDNPKNVEKLRRNNAVETVTEIPKKRRRANVDSEVLLHWIQEQVKNYSDIEISDLGAVFKNGRVLCAVLNRYRPDLLDFGVIQSEEPVKSNRLAMEILEKELGISPIMTAEELTNTEDYLTMATYLTQVYDCFRCEIPHITHPKLELPADSKRSEATFKTVKEVPSYLQLGQNATVLRPSSRHKRHADVLTGVNKPNSVDRKARKRRTIEKLGASIDHENKLPNLARGNADEDFAARIKTMEEKWKEPQPVDKKPKDLMRAIGKIETSDWNIKEIEKKIHENKMGKPSTTNKDKEKVPKWSKEQFLARQTKMEKKHLVDRQDSCEAKFADIDKNIKHLEMKLKEGTSRDLGQNKIATITEKLTSKAPETDSKSVIQKSSSRTAVVLPTPQVGSEFCNFCGKRVYLMERLSAEGRFFHHGCFKCQYCHTQLRLGSYSFDRDGIYGHKFFCIHHYGMQGELKLPKMTRRQSQKRPEIKILDIDNVDLLNNRVQTPERVEFSNLFATGGNLSSDQEENFSQMDEDEWTDKNFGASTAELGSSSDDDEDDESSSLSDTDSDDEDAYEEAIEEPATKEGTLKWAERFNKRYSKKRNDSDLEYDSSDRSSYYENSSDDDDSDTATEGEEEIRARELRKQEVRVEPPVVDTGTDTEIVSEESTSDSSSDEVRNSATEISTDSEFAQDEPTPTREIPSIIFNDFHVTKTRGSGAQARRIQITSGYLQKPKNQTPLPAKTNKKDHIELKLTPLVPSIAPIVLRKPILRNTSDGYALNRTQSTGGIAAKVSLELKKKYLLGNEPNCTGNIQKSGSASTLDTKLKSFHSNISDCQKLLKPATEISASMQTFCTKLDKITPKIEEKPKEAVFQNVLEGRPRSPVHETSIIVPKIDWNKKQSSSDDSLSDNSPNFQFDNIPTVNVEKAEDIPLDSLCLEAKEEENEAPKSITSDRKTLNQPKLLPNWDLANAPRKQEEEEESVGSNAALTETELSDWARDDDFDELNKYDEMGHVCGKDKKETNNKIILTETMNNVLSKNLDNIEFMDTGTEETSSDDNLTNNGYVLFKDEEELVEDSLNPNTGYCIMEPANKFGGEVIDLKPSDLEKIKQKQTQEHEEDSLLIIETQEMTENSDTTTPVTVKAEKTAEIPKMKPENPQKQRLEEKLAKIKAERQDSLEFQEHCQRLQSKIDFGNAKDSIDVRKSRRKSKSDSPPHKPDLIQEESPIIKEITLNLTPTVLYKKELIEKERDVNQKLIQDLVMDKMRTLERKKRNRSNSKFELSKSATVDLNQKNSTPDVILTANPLQKSQTISQVAQKQRPFSVYSVNLPDNQLKTQDNFSLPDVSQTPKAPPRLKHDETKKITEKLKQEARLRARLLSNEELGLSPEDKLVKLREKINKRDLLKESIESLVLNTERRNSWLYNKDSVCNTDQNLANLRTKSITEISKDQNVDAKLMCCKSDPNLLLNEKKTVKKVGKDRERRKSITKLFTTLFTKKSPNSKGLFSRISPQKKDVSKSCTNLLGQRDFEIVVEEPIRRNSFSEVSRQRIRLENSSPPPIPPLPLNYTGNSIRGTDESSEGEHDWRKLTDNKSSCDTLDHINSSMSSLNSSNRKSKGAARKVARQTQLKRHRMAQEIQRKLEETEVKTRELEERGVSVEKALRGEDSSKVASKDESILLQEWFDLMRDRTELRRYEKELMVRAQELELEDSHARLQHELRERLENHEEKTQSDVEIEGSIISEMMEIVAKRDSLIAVLEEDRLRYSNEDRDLEEQMLAKGLRLTPIRKSTTEK